MGNSGSLGNKSKQMFEGSGQSGGPGSFEDIHGQSENILPQTFAGLRVAFANKFCRHSQLYSTYSTEMFPGSRPGSNALNFDYRWSGSDNGQDTLNPHYFELANNGPSMSKMSSSRQCSHGSFMDSLAKFRGRVTGDGLEYLPTCLAVNFKSLLTEYIGPKFTVGLVARDLLLGDRLAIEDSYPGALDTRNLTECELQSLIQVTDKLDIGFQVRRFVDEETYHALDGPLWGIGLGARARLFDGVLLSASVSRGIVQSYLSTRLSPDFQLAFGYKFDSMDSGQCVGRVGCKFTDTPSGMAIKMAADTRGRVEGTIAKELAWSALPLNLILVARCDTCAPYPKYQLGLGAEVP
ncbi:hypothetical protein HDE_07547 [Halotydeus destructor]|nr:hypothetical protein HDE_07547 [Halotydeus destructor]